MSCVLRASGKDFDVDGFIENSSFEPCRIFHKGELKTKDKSKKRNQSGFNLVVSDADLDKFIEQMEDAVGFLKENYGEIQRLKDFPGLEDVMLDFAVGITQEYYSKNILLDNLLMEEAVRCGVKINISVYKTSDE